MYNPVSTYRIQFHKKFTFKQFEEIIPYLHQLGVKTIYASPIFSAVPGSMHGYDITDPLSINPEIGTIGQLRSISRKLRKLGIGWLQDIVPNHMAFHPSNRWLMDVLEKGQRSSYSRFFDILWDSQLYDGRIMVPFLAEPAEDALTEGKIKLGCYEGRLSLVYFEQRYPLRLESYIALLQTPGGTAVKKIIRRIRQTLEIKNNQRFNKASDKLLQKLSPDLQRQFGPSRLKRINNDTALLSAIVNSQYYLLCCWQETSKAINFRRFFTVNSLICLNMQHETVFNEYHRLIDYLLIQGIFQGLRVDHIDGLYDPPGYLNRLRRLAGSDTYIVVEKILEDGEKLPQSWPVQGTTGYDFLAAVNNLLTDKKNKQAFSDFYQTITADKRPLPELIIQKKRFILLNYMRGELDNLYRLFQNLRLAGEKEFAYFSPEIFKESIAEILTRFPIYRCYGNTMPMPEEDAQLLDNLLQQISDTIPSLAGVNNMLKNCLLDKPRFGDVRYNAAALSFYMRLMQFTGPLMAKGVEDTLMYSYNRFIDHNEVGDSPGAFGVGVSEFHRLMQQRFREERLSMNATATHDTKRGEDVRARLNVISNIPEEWVKQVKQWQEMNANLKSAGVPGVNDEYFIYQSLVGAFPMPDTKDEDFLFRLQEYLIKALRESKINSNWSNPDERYEKSAKAFVSRLLNPRGRFWKAFEPFYRRIADLGIVNSLAQTLLKYTCPGVPDMYQGCELWDLSFVDPDNRRPVDYRLRFGEAGDGEWERLWEYRYDGRIKQSLVKHLLNIRAENVKVFSMGDYVPLQVEGKYHNYIACFARHYREEWLITVVPLHPGIVIIGKDQPEFDWDNTTVVLPDGAPMSWQNLLTGEKNYAGSAIELKKIFGPLPVALLRLRHDKRNRSAGVLMHISSLPSPFGIGDLGPGATSFADFLVRSRQQWWQMLPVNPVDAASGFSPYSTTSSFAGNISLISPELLAADGLLLKTALKNYTVQKDRTDFKKAADVKNKLLKIAWAAFSRSASPGDKDIFAAFKINEAAWLDDFAIYQFLKGKYQDKPWYSWPAKYKFRERHAVDALKENAQVDYIKWQQFIFHKQWLQFRAYCCSKGLRLFGDMPFYASYDSADVWANPGYFKIDDRGNTLAVAGVPPDYFSDTGQLWGMPVYNWQALKAVKYDWWVRRIKRNLLFFDLIRLDHFRAFSAYWEVPGGSKNAVNGSWQNGPGAPFFGLLLAELGELPFVAEDLGDIDDKVYQLRDRFALPGMRVLQFAFDENMPVSEHIPHNYMANSFVYTGTHDNNTTKGWYRHNADPLIKSRVNSYLAKKVSVSNVHQNLISLAYASVARTAIIPIQDILGLGENSRMNVPSSPKGNWTWRLCKAQLTTRHEKFLKNLVERYNR